jgi:hypothetical protein
LRLKIPTKADDERMGRIVEFKTVEFEDLSVVGLVNTKGPTETSERTSKVGLAVDVDDDGTSKVVAAVDNDASKVVAAVDDDGK